MNRHRRVLPGALEAEGFFWTSGSDGRLRLLRCERCAFLIHPPVGFCPRCRSREVAPAVVSGQGTLYSFTVNVHPWDGESDEYVIGLVSIREQPDIRLMTNIVGIDPADVSIGMPVEVEFEEHGTVYVPLFRPVPA